MRRTYLFVVMLICTMLFYGCGDESDNNILDERDEIVTDNANLNEDVADEEYINYIKTRPIINGYNLYCEGVTFGDLLDEKYFIDSHWIVEKTDYQGTSFVFVTFQHSGSVTGSDYLHKIVFVCDTSCSGYDILDIYNKDSEQTVGETYVGIIDDGTKTEQELENERRFWLNGRIEANAFNWVDEEFLNEALDEEYVINRNETEAIVSLSTEENFDNSTGVTTDNTNTENSDVDYSYTDWDYTEFAPAPFTVEDFWNLQEVDANWYDNGIFSTYMSMAYPTDTWEYSASIYLDMDNNPFGYMGFEVYTHQCEEAQQVYRYLVPISPANAPEVYAYDDNSNSMKLVFVNGELLE